jgi:hypothetical protein
MGELQSDGCVRLEQMKKPPERVDHPWFNWRRVKKIRKP